jgi:hypothetical protein
MKTIKPALASVPALLAVSLFAGCSSQTPTQQVKPTRADVQASVAATQQRMKEVQADATIPEATKATIVARLKGNMDRTLQANGMPPSPDSK